MSSEQLFFRRSVASIVVLAEQLRPYFCCGVQDYDLERWMPRSAAILWNRIFIDGELMWAVIAAVPAHNRVAVLTRLHRLDVRYSVPSGGLEQVREVIERARIIFASQVPGHLYPDRVDAQLRWSSAEISQAQPINDYPNDLFTDVVEVLPSSIGMCVPLDRVLRFGRFLWMAELLLPEEFVRWLKVAGVSIAAMGPSFCRFSEIVSASASECGESIGWISEVDCRVVFENDDAPHQLRAFVRNAMDSLRNASTGWLLDGHPEWLDEAMRGAEEILQVV